MSTEITTPPLPIVSRLLKPIEFASALLLVVIVVMLLVGVVARYVFSIPIVWIDEVVSLSFLWLAMLGTAIAMHRNEHLRLTLFLEMMPERIRG
ncbi:MAG: TRAP transporter small permease subunit, partial [Burkholderiales bacterium]|nr:TRAP transporter small permease subunit [Burkholderiales bacterium]